MPDTKITNAAMTPKTQSVCKHATREEAMSCPRYRRLVDVPDLAGDLFHGSEYFEPVAEPASTGEPQKECRQFTGRAPDGSVSHCRKPRGHDGSCNPLHGIIFPAARPSEPSAPQIGAYSGIGNEEVKWKMKGLTSQGHAAPQTSAEPKKQCGCVHGDSDPYCPDLLCPNYLAAYHVKPAAPQPVSGEFPFNWPALPTRKRLNPDECGHANITRTVIFEYIDGPNHNGWMCQDCGTEFIPKQAGDAPKVEEIRQLAAAMFGIMRRGMLNLSMKTDMPAWRELGRSSQEHWKTMARYALEALPLLRPYFPPASQTQGLIGLNEQQLEVIAKWAADSPHNIWGNAEVRDLNLRTFARAILSVATPASTARTDNKRVENTFDKLADQGFFEDVKDWPPISRDECMEILTELAAPGSIPQAPATKSFLGLPVYVDNPQFTGYGMAAYDSGDRKRVIGVLLENGHTWEYDAATVREARHEELPKMPRFIRERFGAGAAQPGDDKPEGAE